MAYQNPLAQVVHEGIYDQAFTQGALGRGRGINRSARTPPRNEVFGNVPLPTPLASIQRWRPDRELALLADGGTDSNAADLYEFHLDLFPRTGCVGFMIGASCVGGKRRQLHS